MKAVPDGPHKYQQIASDAQRRGLEIRLELAPTNNAWPHLFLHQLVKLDKSTITKSWQLNYLTRGNAPVDFLFTIPTQHCKGTSLLQIPMWGGGKIV